MIINLLRRIEERKTLKIGLKEEEEVNLPYPVEGLARLLFPFEQYIPVSEGLAVGEKLEISMRYVHALISLISIFMGIIIPMMIDSYLDAHESEWTANAGSIAVIQIVLMGLLAWQHAKRTLSGIIFRSPIQVKN